jgi:diadenosine tetraphosphatase ApaH/serine/threonine PP2A family protein phosphatase
MTLYAFLGDIHSNRPALEAVLEEVDTLKPDIIICTGDVVGYGGDPDFCTDVIRERGIDCVQGNHDRMASNEECLDSIYPLAKTSLEWTRTHLSLVNIEFLANLPQLIRHNGVLVSHSSFLKDHKDPYLNNLKNAYPHFFREASRINQKTPHNRVHLGVSAHAHYPFEFSTDRNFMIHPDNIHGPCVIRGGKNLSPSNIYLIINRSVGQPRDRDPTAGFTTYDSKTDQLRVHHVEYDIKAAQERIKAAGLPEKLAIRLELGR